MKVLCALGEHNYGDPSRGIGPEYAAFMPALRNLGYETVHFELWNRTRHSNFAELNRALLEAVETEKPDVLLSVQLHYEIWLETLRIIGNEKGVATICWTTDDSWKYREASRFLGRAYHAMTTTYPKAVPMYRRDGIRNVLLTQWAASSENIDEPLPADECRYGVSFVGTAHGNRRRMVSKLREKGLNIDCFGYGWPAGPVESGEVHRIFRESAISLNFANSRGENQIKARNFEVPGAGGFLLTEYAPGLENHFSTGKEIEIFHTPDELAEKIEYYIASPEKRDSIAMAGNVRTRRDHTYETRLKEALDFALRSKNAGTDGNFAFAQLARKHHPNVSLRLFRNFLERLCVLIWGERRGPRAARRMVYEMSWRVFGEKTYTASGLPGRMFPEI